MKQIFWIVLVLITFLSGCKDNSQKAEEIVSKKPNIIFLFSDDQSYKAVNALGNPEIITPTMDRLVDEGVTFTHAYNMGGWNGAICLASRAMVISGRSVWRAKEISENYSKNEELNKTWPRIMESAGYETYMTGKWHVRAKADSIFNHVGHVLPGMPNQTPDGYNRPKSENDTLWKPWKKEFDGFWKGGKHWSEMVKDDAVSFIDNASKQDKPFFMYIAFNAPHDPRQSPKKYVDKYPLDNIAVPESFMDKYTYAEEMDSGEKLRDERLAPFPRTDYSVKVNRQEYYAITSHLDDQLKDILSALEEKGVKENTYIFFSSDHGLACGEHGLLGKQNMFDHSVRVPLMVVGPNIPKGKKVETDVYLQDIMASSLDVAGIEKPDFVDFNSLMNLARGEQKEGNYNAIFGMYQQKSQRMIRKDGYKLILYPKSKTVLLYNLVKDPNELKNLSGDSNNDDKIKELFKDLIDLQKTMEDKLDLREVFTDLIFKEV